MKTCGLLELRGSKVTLGLFWLAEGTPSCLIYHNILNMVSKTYETVLLWISNNKNELLTINNDDNNTYNDYLKWGKNKKHKDTKINIKSKYGVTPGALLIDTPRLIGNAQFRCQSWSQKHHCNWLSDSRFCYGLCLGNHSRSNKTKKSCKKPALSGLGKNSLSCTIRPPLSPLTLHFEFFNILFECNKTFINLCGFQIFISLNSLDSPDVINFFNIIVIWSNTTISTWFLQSNGC